MSSLLFSHVHHPPALFAAAARRAAWPRAARRTHHCDNARLPVGKVTDWFAAYIVVISWELDRFGPTQASSC